MCDYRLAQDLKVDVFSNNKFAIPEADFRKKIAKYAPYQTVSVGLLFVSVQSKHRNSVVWYRSETTETNV
jgi:light-regulated signal transduction histidine kinase (bacteriophytochrome)